MKHFTSIVSSSLGNIIEWYDFGLFTIFSPLFSQLFFPTINPRLTLLATFSIFSIGFFFRPLGALIFGYLGDKRGRAKTLRLSILMISVPTLLIGILPTYQQIGIGAPLLLVCIRIWQGISIGGEFGGNLIYLAETAPTAYRATFTSFANSGANVGILLAALVGVITSSLISPHTLNALGWRIPYILSGILCLAIYRYRLKIQETQVFDYLKMKKKLANNPIKVMIKNNIPHLLRTLGLVCMGSTFYYFSFIYLPIYLSQRMVLSVEYISLLILTLISLMILLIPISGLICDYLGRKKMLLFNAALIALLIIPGFYFLQYDNRILAIFILLLFAIASSLEQGVTGVAIVENFPPPARYTGLSLGHNLGNGILGGTVPIVSSWLISFTHLTLAPAFYIAICAGITGMVALWWTSETKGIDLSESTE